VTRRIEFVSVFMLVIAVFQRLPSTTLSDRRFARQSDE
jgi:hypothetical protein